MPASTQTDTLAAVLEELRAANRWLQILAEPAFRERLEVNLPTSSDRQVYQASLGGSTREVEQATGVPKSTIASMWGRWSAAGIMQATDVSGRYRRLVDLTSLGMSIK